MIYQKQGSVNNINHKKYMKKILLGLAIAFFSLGGMMMAFAQNQGGSSELEPRYVLTDNFLIRAFVGENVRHNFGKVFSADLSKGQLRAIEMLGVKTEPVSIFTIFNSCRNDKVRLAQTKRAGMDAGI